MVDQIKEQDVQFLQYAEGLFGATVRWWMNCFLLGSALPCSLPGFGSNLLFPYYPHVSPKKFQNIRGSLVDTIWKTDADLLPSLPLALHSFWEG